MESVLLRSLLPSVAAMGGGFGALRASVAAESYALLVVGIGLLIAGIFVLLRDSHPGATDDAARAEP